tara:strand:- start:270 stop:578 length:309 start_codon:yes stop_codon:yes gene_type:complete
MKNKLEKLNNIKSTSSPELKFIEALIDYKKIDKNIIAEILSIPSEISLIRKLYSGWSAQKIKVLRTKQSVLMHVRGNIHQSKMDKAEKMYCYILLNIVLSDS